MQEIPEGIGRGYKKEHRVGAFIHAGDCRHVWNVIVDAYRMLECIRSGGGGVLIDIHVIPNSKAGTGGVAWGYDKFRKRIRLRISSPAIEGKANKQVIRIFSDLVGNCEIISGKLSRKKTLMVRDFDAAHVSGILDGMLNSRTG